MIIDVKEVLLTIKFLLYLVILYKNDDNYFIFKDTLVIWTDESTNCQYAFSFLKNEGRESFLCDYFYLHISLLCFFKCMYMSLL